MTALSNANTSGLSEAWSRLSKTFSDRFYEGYEPEIEAMSAAVVTAASAQARIAELEAENESHRSGGWILAETKRRQEAEARADRLAKALEAARGTLDAIDCPLTTDRTVAGAAKHAVKRIDAALQQETQK